MEREDEARELVTRLYVPYRMAMAHIEACLREAFPDLRSAQLVVFHLIEHPPAGSRLTDLAEAANLTKASMVELVDGLERRGYVERIPDPSDRRAKRIRLTERGWTVHEYGGELVEELQAAWTARLGPAKMGQLLALLRELDTVLTLKGSLASAHAPASRVERTDGR